MPKRGVGFNANEISILLDAVEEYLPIGQNDWEMVERMHSRYYPQSGRTKESLKRKFIQLYLTKIPTGDPKCPDDVRRAKHLLEEIKKRSDLSDGEGGGDDADEGNGDDSEEEDEGGADEIGGQGSNEENPHLQETPAQPPAVTVTTTDNIRPMSPFTAEPVSRTGSKSIGSKKKTSSSRKRKHDDFNDDDDFSMKNCMKFLMTQHAIDKEERKAEEASRRDQMMQMQQMLMAVLGATASQQSRTLPVTLPPPVEQQEQNTNKNNDNTMLPRPPPS